MVNFDFDNIQKVVLYDNKGNAIECSGITSIHSSESRHFREDMLHMRQFIDKRFSIKLEYTEQKEVNNDD
jgi:hypothetical protein